MDTFLIEEKMMDYRERMITMIYNVIDGTWTVPYFSSNYQHFYIEETPDSALIDDRDVSFFGDINEKLDWVAKDPPLEDRKNGWINETEFIIWLKCFIKENKPNSM